jgi:hypothetical protein
LDPAERGAKPVIIRMAVEPPLENPRRSIAAPEAHVDRGGCGDRLTIIGTSTQNNRKTLQRAVEITDAFLNAGQAIRIVAVFRVVPHMLPSASDAPIR